MTDSEKCRKALIELARGVRDYFQSPKPAWDERQIVRQMQLTAAADKALIACGEELNPKGREGWHGVVK